MKFYALIGFILIANSVFAGDLVDGKVIGKPGIHANFLDKDIIFLALGESKPIELTINYSADVIKYELQMTDGLEVIDLNQSFINENAIPHTLIVPLKIKINRPGRYYLHVRIETYDQGVATRGVLSKIISSEPDSTESVQKKSVIPNKFRILPVVETVKDAEDEQ